jgi:DNA-binding response OmpR family regulator
MTGANKVLCVEDDADTCELIAAILYDYDVFSAQSVQAALDLLEKETFNYVILDMLLPDGSGLELCKQIRSADQATPIVFVTGSGSLNLNKVREAGGNELVHKASPDFIDRLVSCIEHLGLSHLTS